MSDPTPLSDALRETLAVLMGAYLDDQLSLEELLDSMAAAREFGVWQPPLIEDQVLTD